MNRTAARLIDCFNKPVIHILLITVLGLIVYSNTFHVPFRLDEEIYLVHNPVVWDIRYPIETLRASNEELYKHVKQRRVGFLSFAVNYRVHGFEVEGYHLINIAIHILNALLLYSFVLLTFKTPALTKSLLYDKSKYIALFSSFFFVSHPVQSEAVNYIYQRFTSLAAFFYLLSVVSYLKWRTTEQPDGTNKENRNIPEIKNILLYLCSFLSAVVAMKTKENAFTLPFVIAIYELIFFKGRIVRRITGLIPILMTSFIIPLTFIIGMGRGLEQATRGVSTEGITRYTYLITELRVLITYMRLLFFPLNLNFDYDYPIYQSFTAPAIVSSVLFFACFFVLFGYFFFLLRRTYSEFHIMLLGVLWFFITMSVESSLIPQVNPVNEYRVYLPSIGFFPALLTGLFLALNKFEKGKMQTGIYLALISVVSLFALSAYTRNILWNDNSRFWEDVVKKSPGKDRPHYILGNIYRDSGQFDKAQREYLKAVKLNFYSAEAHNEFGTFYGRLGQFDKADKEYYKAVMIKPNFVEAHYNRGILFQQFERFEEAEREFLIVLMYRPDLVEAHNNLGILYQKHGQLDKAEGEFLAAVNMKPDFAEAHCNLGILYQSRELYGRAAKEYQIALALNPYIPGIRDRLDDAYKNLSSQ